MGKLRLALFLAIESEEALVEAHYNRITGKYFDMKVVRKCRSNIRHFRSISEKIDRMTATTPSEVKP